MAPVVAIDARDAYAPVLRGWGRYSRCLLGALSLLDDVPFELAALAGGARVPEVLFEQLVLPLELRSRRASLVHATNCFLPLVRSCPGVVTIHDLAFEAWPDDFAPRTRWKYRTFARLAAYSAERVIVPSHSTADDLVRRYGIDRDKIRVIAEAPALPAGTRVPPAYRYVLAIGDLRAKKNLGTLVRAFIRLRVEGYRLVLAGVDTGQGESLKRLAGRAPMQLTGYVNDAELDALIRGAELLVHPSLYEGFGLVVLEAMARGTPVVVARATSLPEAGGDAAAYFDPDSGGELELAALLGELLADPDRRAAMAARGRDWARGFTWERAARQTADVYQELL